MKVVTRGPNASLIGQLITGGGFQTPALLLDLDALRGNIALMADKVRAAGRLLRPHVKSHKCVEIARLQIEAGAAGLCCATIREVEVMAGAGFDGILLTAPVVTDAGAARIAAARQKAPSLMVAVDSQTGFDALERVATADRPIDVLVDIDVGVGRTGLIDRADVVRVAAAAKASPVLRYRGVQAYYGHLQHVADFGARHAKISEQWRKLEKVIAALTDAGLAPEIISGGGTGTHHPDLVAGPFTEIQPGSYIFMDRQYAAVALTPDGSPFAHSLTIGTGVVSRNQPGRAIIDAGLKAMATDAGVPAVFGGAPLAAQYNFMGDEHGRLDVADARTLPGLGELVRLLPPHCDPTVNLHDRFHIVQGDTLMDIWTIDARGY